jgi:TPR repeat protein
MSVPIYDYALANEGLASKATKQFYSCCGKRICVGCVQSFAKSGNLGKCPFCNSERADKTDEESLEELMRRVEANDAGAMTALADSYCLELLGLQQDQERAMELWKRAADLGYSHAHYNLGIEYHQRGNMKKKKFHNEAAAMAGHEVARNNLGCAEAQSGNMERAVNHFKIAASAGNHHAMNNLLIAFNKGLVPQDEIESALTSYNNSCAEMRSKARDGILVMYSE